MPRVLRSILNANKWSPMTFLSGLKQLTAILEMSDSLQVAQFAWIGCSRRRWSGVNAEKKAVCGADVKMSTSSQQGGRLRLTTISKTFSVKDLVRTSTCW